MRPLLIYFFFFLSCISISAQNDSITVKDVDTKEIYKVSIYDLVDNPNKIVIDTAFWERKNIIGLDVNEVAFVNWNAGGTNSIAGLLNAELQRNYKKGNLVWTNRMVARFGVNMQSDTDVRKTDDMLEFYSTIGYRKDTLSNWYSSANISFKTQFADGFSYNNDVKKLLSTFMAPAYLFVGVGTIYSHDIEKFNFYLSPLTLKSTFVLNAELANAGAFGVTSAVYDVDGNLIKKGKKARHELGFLVTSIYEKELFKNIYFRNVLSLYTDYINNFGNIDVDWEFVFNLQVNDYIRAVFGSHLKYDDDIKFTETINGEEVQVSGAKVQWKQILGVGVVFDF